jgi:hypothetical protein
VLEYCTKLVTISALYVQTGLQSQMYLRGMFPAIKSEACAQGDQIGGRIFSHLGTVYFGQFVWKHNLLGIREGGFMANVPRHKLLLFFFYCNLGSGNSDLNIVCCSQWTLYQISFEILFFRIHKITNPEPLQTDVCRPSHIISLFWMSEEFGQNKIFCTDILRIVY